MKLESFLIGALILSVVGLAVSYSARADEIQTNDYTFACVQYDCHLHLSNRIEFEENYKLLFIGLSKLTPRHQLTVHLAGQGGVGSTMSRLINIIEASGAQTIALVEGDVASAHAFIAVAMDKVYSAPENIFLFHIPAYRASVEELCADDKGKTDRGQDKEIKCRQYYSATLLQAVKLTVRLTKNYLTAEQMREMLKGYDIILTARELGFTPYK